MLLESLLLKRAYSCVMLLSLNTGHDIPLADVRCIDVLSYCPRNTGHDIPVHWMEVYTMLSVSSIEHRTTVFRTFEPILARDIKSDADMSLL